MIWDVYQKNIYLIYKDLKSISYIIVVIMSIGITYVICALVSILKINTILSIFTFDMIIFTGLFYLITQVYTEMNYHNCLESNYGDDFETSGSGSRSVSVSGSDISSGDWSEFLNVSEGGERTNVCENPNNIQHHLLYPHSIYLLQAYIQRYFAIDENKQKLITLLTKENHEDSIRKIIDNTTDTYPIERYNGTIELFIIKDEFDRMVKTYGERYFHYTSKINVIPIHFTDDQVIYLSLGQLHFYHWWFENIPIHI